MIRFLEVDNEEFPTFSVEVANEVDAIMVFCLTRAAIVTEKPASKTAKATERNSMFVYSGLLDLQLWVCYNHTCTPK